MSDWWDGDVQQEEPSAADVLSNPGASNFGDAGNEGVWQGSYDSAPQSGYQPGNGGLDTNSITAAAFAMSPGPAGAGADYQRQQEMAAALEDNKSVPGAGYNPFTDYHPTDDPSAVGRGTYVDDNGGWGFSNWGEWLRNMKDLGVGAAQIASNLSPMTFARQAFSDATGTNWLGGFAGPGRDWLGNPTSDRAQQLANGMESIAPLEVFQPSDGGQPDNNGGQPDTTQNPSTVAPVYGDAGGYFGRGKKWNLTDYTGGYGV